MVIGPVLGIAIPQSEHVCKNVVVKRREQRRNLIVYEGKNLVAHLDLAISRFPGVYNSTARKDVRTWDTLCYFTRFFSIIPCIESAMSS